MTISIHIKYDAQELTSSFNLGDTETLTQMPWQELYEKAQEKKLPCLAVCTAILQDKDNYQCKHYEGCMFNKHVAVNGLEDPLTCQPILKIYYVFVDCFQAKVDRKTGRLQDRILDQAELHLRSKDHLPVKNEALIPIFFDGLNLFTEDSAEEQVGKSQFIIGAHLQKLHPKSPQYLRWIWCASQHQIRAAQDLFDYLKSP